jgi:hypothetical protein
LPLPGIKPRSPGRPVRSQTLYWFFRSTDRNIKKLRNVLLSEILAMLFQHYFTTLYQLYLSYTVDPLFSALCGIFPDFSAETSARRTCTTLAAGSSHFLVMPWRVAGRDEILKAGNCVDRHTRFLRFDPTPRKGQVWVQRGADSGGLQHQLSDPVSPLPQHFETSWMFCLLTYPLVVALGGSSRP